MASNALAIVEGLLASGMTKAAIGREIGYGRSSVSRWLTDGHNGPAIEAAVLARFDRLECPYLKSEISRGDCAGYASRPCPTSNPREVRHWRSCQSCPHNPNGGAK